MKEFQESDPLKIAVLGWSFQKVLEGFGVQGSGLSPSGLTFTGQMGRASGSFGPALSVSSGSSSEANAAICTTEAAQLLPGNVWDKLFPSLQTG